MEQYTTFKKLIDKLEEFANKHPNINSFGFGNLVEFGKDVENTAPLYPLLFVVPQAIQYNEGLTQYSLQIFLADRLDDDNDGSVSIISQMSLISKDLLGIFKLNEDFMYLADFDFPITAAPFLERFNDVLAGVSMTINFNVSDYLDVCQLNEIITSPTPTPTHTPTPTITPTITPTPSITPSNTPTITPTITETPQPTTTPTITPSPSQVSYDLLAENGDTLLSESGDNLRREQDI